MTAIGRRAKVGLAMADKHQHIDLNTLQKVEQLLTSADLAGTDDRSPRTPQLTTVDAVTISGDALAPLPQRR